MPTTPFPVLNLGPELGFAGGTRVHTQEGLKPIESIRAGDWVLTHPLQPAPPRRRREPAEYLYKRVARTSWADVQALVRISLQNLADGIEDHLLCATGQAIWVQPAGWLAASHVRAAQALVLSFNGNALVQKVQRSDQATRVYALEVQDCSSYYVERLGAWVGADADAVVQAAPAAETRPAFDFSQPQLLLRIDNYYNDTLARPEAPKPVASAPAPAAPRQAPSTSGTGVHFVKPMPAQPELEAVINKLRASFKLRQQRMNTITLGSVLGPKPPWVKPTDGLAEFFEHQERLLTEGHIVWGALVQANQLLFKPGDNNSPGLLVHSPDAYFDARPDELRAIGRTFFSFKNTDPTDPELKEVARLVTDEMDRSMGFELPRVFSSKAVRSATFMVFRKHVPNGILSAGLFPILTHPSTRAVMMVPFEFWPIELIVLWKENRL